MRQTRDRNSNWRQTVQHCLLPVLLIVLVLQLIAVPAQATGVYQIPPLSPDKPTWVIDEANVLSRASEGSISGKLKKLAQETGNEVRMVTIHRLDYGETIETFANQLFEKWFPAEANQSNQVLLVLDTVTNTTAIRTGDAVKSLMPDEIAESVASETVFVPLRQGDKYNQAIGDASDRIVAVLSGQPDPGPPEMKEEISVESTFTAAEDTDTNSATLIVVGLLIVATVVPMVTYYMYVR